MSTAELGTLRNRLETVIALARLLERVDHSPVAVGADQYRALVRQLGVALTQEMPDEALQAVLGAHPGAAEVYENMHYAQSGLSRSSLERSVESEKLARQVLARAARHA
jgi:methyl coenzyme M reductase alpha subunit